MEGIKVKKENVVEMLLITLGSILVSVSLQLFLVPGKLAAGGVSGLAIVLTNIFPQLTTAQYVLFLNIILFAVGFIFLGKAFGVKTIWASAVLTGALFILEWILPKNYMVTDDIFLNTFFGTLIAAIGMVLVFNHGGSTGGTDIIAKILNKYFHSDIGKSLLVVDFIVTSLGFATFGPKIGLYSIISVLLNGTLIDRLLLGLKTAKEILIMSNKTEEIRNYIIKDLDRSCTLLKGKGGYTQKEVSVIYVVLNRSDFIKLKQFIKTVDTRAFISVNEVHEVLGEGYDDITIL